ncbi:hypothetical protein E0Z10_g6837 [Xylaria hypoxylon]|uniref:Ecp2 effector protein domain-containing protein n=1 Tax=Xylaria hypoxylon TaxID=37992 RepID=A0A4Z0YSA3_9PEZI|nr:hypothetical protein E0Z10_g6837 [Xylaria hypoxylon]
MKMRPEALGTIVACLAGFLGAALATSVDNAASPQHIHRHHHHRGFNHPHALPVGHGTQLEERKVPQSPNGPVYRCHDPHPEIFGPAPPVEDCDNVIRQFAALTTDISLNLVEGCYQIVSGNCTGLACPQREGETIIPGSLAAQYMASPLRDECIAKGQRGWWIDGQGWGIGVYLT